LGQGACGYLLKQNGIDELVPSLQVLQDGGSPLSPQVARSIVRSIQINELSPLSPRESTVLKLLSQGKTYSSIASALDLSNETVKTHLKNIYKKLNVNSKAQAIQKAMEEQLVVGVYS
jgi:DNA-binding NarL/FixJ family response regulator